LDGRKAVCCLTNEEDVGEGELRAAWLQRRRDSGSGRTQAAGGVMILSLIERRRWLATLLGHKAGKDKSQGKKAIPERGVMIIYLIERRRWLATVLAIKTGKTRARERGLSRIEE
jgi:hypothetical protein